MKKYFLLLLALFYTVTVSASDKPNILLIHVDDIGWGDYSTYNPSGKIKTTAIDKLAETGMKFNHAHTPAALCAPTRYSILSGNYPWRGRFADGDWHWHTDTQFLPGQKTFAHFVKQGGYRTAMFGKANLGLVYERMIDKNMPDFTSKLAEGPIQWGFDYSYIIPRGHQSITYAYYENNILVGEPHNIKQLQPGSLNGGRITIAGPGQADWNSVEVGKTLTEKAVAFIDNHLVQYKGQPFLIHFNTDGAHSPFTPPDELWGQKVKGETKLTAQADMILETSVILGHFVDVLKERNLYQNTLIIITSDNGGIPDQKLIDLGHNSVGYLRGRKGTIWEGGTRVPFIVHWGDDTVEGSTIKPGTVTNQLISTHDLAATFAELAGIKIEEGQAIDSISIVPILLGKQPEDKPLRDHLLVQSRQGRDTAPTKIPNEFQERFKNYGDYLDFITKQAQDAGFDGIGHAVIKDDWKLFFGLTDKPEFFVNLKEDINETINLIDKPEHKERIAELTTIFQKLRKSQKNFNTSWGTAYRF